MKEVRVVYGSLEFFYSCRLLEELASTVTSGNIFGCLRIWMCLLVSGGDLSLSFSQADYFQLRLGYSGQKLWLGCEDKLENVLDTSRIHFGWCWGVPSLSTYLVESKGGNSVLERREDRIVKMVRVLVHCDRFFLYRMRGSYVDGFMCQRKHLLISREPPSILISRSQTGTFSHSCLLWKCFLLEPWEGFSAEWRVYDVEGYASCFPASVGVLLQKWILMAPSCSMLRTVFSWDFRYYWDISGIYMGKPCNTQS